ncbi:HAMP domain-containing sensor histidine kinase [Cryobacterium sp. Hh7]|uniref:sensor histidine kinase n=1 Tax=Cryobacterium sp. Hh7 TaxID=1259159 RepID=UPI00141B7E39|nr:sensor histidine kinase [Cryobacterium sp. Hh7]
MSDETSMSDLLASPKAADRLRGARLLLNSPAPADMQRMRRIRSVEKDSWVQNALDSAFANWARGGEDRHVEESWIVRPGASDLEGIKAEAIQSVTQVILHEMRPLVLDVRTEASTEVPAYVTSQTSTTIDRLRAFLDTINRLNEAAAAPVTVEFDLSEFLAAEIRECKFTDEQAVTTRKDPLIVKGDPDLLRLAVRNALRNAVEASEGLGKQVVVNSGLTSREAWVVILDEGVGLPSSSDKVWKPGVTKKSKDEHFGWGLTIAQRAMLSCSGSMKLSGRQHAGTACEIRWSQGNGDSVE